MPLKSFTTIRTLPDSPGWYWYRHPEQDWQVIQVSNSETPDDGNNCLVASIFISDGRDNFLCTEMYVEDLEGEWGDEVKPPRTIRRAVEEGVLPAKQQPGRNGVSPRSTYNPPPNQEIDPDKLSWFFYWIYERHQMWLRRTLGNPKPWTNDEIMLDNWFCNPYRELDKTTVWFRNNIRGPLSSSKEIVMATIIFRWFNFIPTGEILIKPTDPKRKLYGLFTNWDTAEAAKRLHGQKQVFTSAHVVASGTGISKLDSIANILGSMWEQRDTIYATIQSSGSLQAAHRYLTTFPSIGDFFAYEIVSDLRHTHVLDDAEDIMTWANPGPGAKRGLNRLYNRPITFDRDSYDWNSEMADLLTKCHDGETAASYDFPLTEMINKPYKGLSSTYIRNNLPALPFEMREIESSLCEFDKYMRLKDPHEGEYSRHNPKQSKRKYPGRS